MKITRTLTGLAATAVAASVVTAVPAQAATQASTPDATSARVGATSLAAVLAKDGTGFDKNGRDFDIAEAAILAVLKAKPNSPLKILTQGSKRVTVFIPTDKAFQKLVSSLTGSGQSSEADTAQVTLGLGINTVENVLLYHAVVGKTLDSTKVVAAAGTPIKTALGVPFEVKVKGGAVSILDQDPDAPNARAIPALLDLNKGNKQIAHGISQVLRPSDL